jgi:RNA recognition motif-containing protein
MSAEAVEGGAIMAHKLFVGGIAFGTTEDGLQRFFSQAGEVVSSAIITDRETGRSRGFGFVEMTNLEDAKRAVADLDGRDLDGRPLKIELAKPKLGGSSAPNGREYRR